MLDERGVHKEHFNLSGKNIYIIFNSILTSACLDILLQTRWKQEKISILWLNYTVPQVFHIVSPFTVSFMFIDGSSHQLFTLVNLSIVLISWLYFSPPEVTKIMSTHQVTWAWCDHHRHEFCIVTHHLVLKFSCII